LPNSTEAGSPQAVRSSPIRTAVGSVMGWLAGYLVSLASSIVLFALAGIAADKPPSVWVLLGVSLYCMVFGAIGGLIGSSFSRRHALGIGVAIALTHIAMATRTWHAAPGQSHWTELIAFLLISPSALFGALLRRETN